MLLVWSGKGWVVPLFNFVAFFLYAISLTPFDHKHLNLLEDSAVHAVSCSIFGGLAVFLIYRFSLSAKKAKPRVLIDVESGKKVVQRKSAGTFFGIKTANWTVISGVLWAVIAVAGVAGGDLR
jgi:hypothetical protein